MDQQKLSTFFAVHSIRPWWDCGKLSPMLRTWLSLLPISGAWSCQTSLQCKPTLRMLNHYCHKSACSSASGLHQRLTTAVGGDDKLYSKVNMAHPKAERVSGMMGSEPPCQWILTDIISNQNQCLKNAYWHFQVSFFLSLSKESPVSLLLHQFLPKKQRFPYSRSNKINSFHAETASKGIGRRKCVWWWYLRGVSAEHF